MRIRVQKGFFTSTIGLTILGTVFASFLAAGGVFIYYYVKYSRMIDARLSGNVLQNTTYLQNTKYHILHQKSKFSIMNNSTTNKQKSI